jgi:tRNA1(Val) A37 N6-methylase TrmN6
MPALEGRAEVAPFTEDAILGGRVTLRQPRNGYRVGIDPIMLAAAAPAGAASALDLGCGVGAAALCLARRVAGITIAGLELQPTLAALARENVASNALTARVAIHEGNLLQPPAAVRAGSYDLVLANPPFHAAGRATAPADSGRAQGHVEGDADLADWIRQALRLAAPKGTLLLIHRPERLGELLTLLAGRAGAIVVFPLWPALGRKAGRIIVLARKGSAAPFTLAPGLVLHEPDGRYTAAADAVLRGAALGITD